MEKYGWAKRILGNKAGDGSWEEGLYYQNLFRQLIHSYCQKELE